MMGDYSGIVQLIGSNGTWSEEEDASRANPMGPGSAPQPMSRYPNYQRAPGEGSGSTPGGIADQIAGAVQSILPKPSQWRDFLVYGGAVLVALLAIAALLLGR